MDALSDRVMNAGSRESLTAATRALDRVLFWQFYFVPARVVEPARRMMWNKFGQPSTVAPYVSGFPATWWWDEEKAQRVEQVLRRSTSSLSDLNDRSEQGGKSSSNRSDTTGLDFYAGEDSLETR